MQVDVNSLYQLLENQIVPLYYAKPDGKLPLAWLQLMRESIRSVTPVFNTHRMVKEYAERLYIRAEKAHQELAREWPRVARAYRRALEDVSSPSAWEKTFDAARPTPGPEDGTS